jgi:uncharacterized protein with HEPN domain
MSRSGQDRLRDIHAAIERVKAYQASLGGEQSEMALSAILREIGIVGEAVNVLPDELTAKRPEIPWRQIAGMRNFLVHEYFNIDKAIVEDVIKNDLDPLAVAISALLDDAGT